MKSLPLIISSLVCFCVGLAIGSAPKTNARLAGTSLKLESTEAPRVHGSLAKSMSRDESPCNVDTTASVVAVQIGHPQDHVDDVETDSYPDGILKSRGTRKNGVPTGHWIFWYEDGRKKSEGDFDSNGSRMGTWIEWFMEGSRKSSAWINGVEDGRSVTVGASGCLIAEEFYVVGRLEGLKRRWHPNGQILESLEYHAGQPVDGMFSSFFATGSKSSEGEYRGGNQIGTWREWSEDGTLRKQICYQGIITEETEWFETGVKKSERSLRGSVLNGLCVSYHASGQIEESGLYVDGKPSGRFVRRHENGQDAWQGTYTPDGLDGLVTEWYDNGVKSSETMYCKGEVSGSFASWDREARRTVAGQYAAGKKDGEWRFYRPLGEVDHIEVWEKGQQSK